mgnify:FL=1
MWKTSSNPINPRVILNSGASLSIQASSSHYCLPREDEGPYTHYEMGFPENLEESDLAMLEEFEEAPGEGVCPYVPKDVLKKIINRNGGIKKGQLP